jgi:hypothetical protein
MTVTSSPALTAGNATEKIEAAKNCLHFGTMVVGILYDDEKYETDDVGPGRFVDAIVGLSAAYCEAKCLKELETELLLTRTERDDLVPRIKGLSYGSYTLMAIGFAWEVLEFVGSVLGISANDIPHEKSSIDDTNNFETSIWRHFPALKEKRRDLPRLDFGRVGEIKGEIAKELKMLVPAPSPPAPSPPARLIVDLDRRTITLDGKTYNVNSEQACRWVKVLTDHPGVWISGKSLKNHDPELTGARTDLLRKHLSKKVNNLIESKVREGSRILL